jgi:hypothetical protein
MQPLVGLAGVIATELAAGATFSFTPVGGASRSYIGLSSLAGPAGPVSNATTGGMRFAMLWE